MAMSAQTSNNTSFYLNPQNVAYRNDAMILNELKDKNSIFFSKAGNDDKVHVIIPRIRDAAANKNINMAQGVYIAQGFKTMGIKTRHAITYNGARSMGTYIPKGKPHVEVALTYKLDEKGKNTIVRENETLSQNSDSTSKLKLEANKQALETGYRNVAYTYFPASSVGNAAALKKAFLKPHTPDINTKAWEKFREEYKAEKAGKSPKEIYNLPVIDGNLAKDWKEHVKNCMTGNEVVLSKEKATEFATAMINDLENAREQGNPFLFQQTAKNAAAELYKEAKDRSIEQQREVLGLEEKAPEVEPQPYSTEEEISF